MITIIAGRNLEGMIIAMRIALEVGVTWKGAEGTKTKVVAGMMMTVVGEMVPEATTMIVVITRIVATPTIVGIGAVVGIPARVMRGAFVTTNARE